MKMRIKAHQFRCNGSTHWACCCCSWRCFNIGVDCVIFTLNCSVFSCSRTARADFLYMLTHIYDTYTFGCNVVVRCFHSVSSFSSMVTEIQKRPPVDHIPVRFQNATEKNQHFFFLRKYAFVSVVCVFDKQKPKPKPEPKRKRKYCSDLTSEF